MRLRAPENEALVVSLAWIRSADANGGGEAAVTHCHLSANANRRYVRQLVHDAGA